MNNRRIHSIGINGLFIRKPATGIGQVSWHFIKTLSKSNDNKNKFIVYVEEKVPTRLKKIANLNNIEFKIIKGWYKRDDLIRKILWEKFWLPAQIKKDSCQSFLSLYQSATILPKKIKHVMLVHDVVPKVFPGYLNNWRKKIYYKFVDQAIKQATEILTISEFSKKEIAKTYNTDLDKIKVNYVACDPIFKTKLSEQKQKDILEKYNLNSTEKYVFSFGGFDSRKNVVRVIQAYGRLASELLKNKNILIPKLVLGGKFHKHLVPLVIDVEKEINSVVQKYKLDKKLFQMIGFVEQEDLPALYQSAEVFIYPSLYEGFGMPVLEAMLSETPVITSSTTSIPEVISEEAGYLIEDPANVEEIKNKLKEALEDTPENKQQKITKALQESQKFSWEKFIERVLIIMK